MANEFIIKNGFESKGDSEITGSLNVSGARFDVEAVLGETKYISTPNTFYKETYNPVGKVIFRTSDANSPIINQGNSQFGTGLTELRQSDLLSGVVTNYSYCSISANSAQLIHRHSGSAAFSDSGYISNDAGLFVVDKHSSPKGIQYSDDYSATYVSRSLVDRDFVEKYVAASGSGDNMANSNLTFDGSYYSELNGNSWQIKNSTATARILLDVSNGSGTSDGMGYGGAAVSGKHTFYNLTSTGTQPLCNMSFLNGLKLSGGSLENDYLNFGSAGIVLYKGAHVSYGASINIYPDIILKTRHSSFGVILDTNNFISFKKNGTEHSRTDSSSRWILRGSAVVGSEKISLQDDTLIKGSDNALGTTGFKVTDVNNNSLVDIRNNGQTCFGGAKVVNVAHIMYNPSNQAASLLRLMDNNGTIGINLATQGRIETNQGTTATFKTYRQGGVPHIELYHPSRGKIVDLQSGACHIDSTLTIGAQTGITGARFCIKQASAIVNQQLFFGNITSTTSGRLGSDTGFGVDQKGFESFDTTLNKKFIWNGTSWDEVAVLSPTGKLDLSTTTDGFLMPRLTTTQKNAISSPDTNLMLFDTTLNTFQRYNGSAWVDVAGSSSPLTTKGDLYTFDTADARLPLGTNGQALVVDTTEATGLKYVNISETATVGGGLLVDLGMSNTNQAITVAAGATIINFDDTVTGAIDKNGDWDNTNKKFVVSSTSGNGTYQFEVNLFSQNSTAGYYNLQAFVNGSIKTPNGAFAMTDAVDDSGFDGVAGTISLDLVVGDEVEIKLQSYQATTTISANGNWNFTQGMRISKASGIKGDKGDPGTGAPVSLSKTLTVQEPTASDDITVFRTDVAITVQEVIACSTGTSPSTTYQLKHHTDRSNAGNALTTSAATTSTTTGDVASLSDATIPANSWVWFESTVASGTSVYLSIDIRYTED